MTTVMMSMALASGPPSAWKVGLEAAHDILIARDALPFLPDLAARAEEHHSLLEECAVVDGNGRIYVGTTRTSRKIALTNNPKLPAPLAPFAVMLGAVEGALAMHYVNAVNPYAQVRKGVGFDLLRYGVGQKFECHVDVVGAHPVYGSRQLSVVAFCNRVEEGGELHFPRQGVTITPEPGMAVVFPSGLTHPHESKPVVRGVKYSVVTWFH